MSKSDSPCTGPRLYDPGDTYQPGLDEGLDEVYADEDRRQREELAAEEELDDAEDDDDDWDDFDDDFDDDDDDDRFNWAHPLNDGDE